LTLIGGQQLIPQISTKQTNTLGTDHLTYGQLLFERYQTGSLSNWCWQGIPNTGGRWKKLCL
jgi:hypothetical protein